MLRVLRLMGAQWFTTGDRVTYGPGSPTRTGWCGTIERSPRDAPLVEVRWDHGDVELVPRGRLILLASAGTDRARTT